MAADVGKKIFAGVRNSSGLLWLFVIVLAACAVLSVDVVNDTTAKGLGALADNRMAAGAALAAVVGLAVYALLRQQGATAIVAAVVVAAAGAWLVYAKPDNGTVHGTVDLVQGAAARARAFVASLRPFDWRAK
jgi:hypothetical protein